MAQAGIINKWGNSLAFRIPSYVVHHQDIKPGDKVSFYYNGNFILVRVDKTNNQQLDEWLVKFDRGEADLDDMPTF